MGRSFGQVYLVGAGPGAADLITLRGARILEAADIVFHDALVHPETLALARRAEKIAVGKRCGRHTTAQRFINKRLVDAARTHRIVVRLKGGDPMLFGRAHEEVSALREANIAYEIVPGVTAALSAAAETGISLTQRGVARSVAFVTPRVAAGEAPSGWAKAAAAADTAVIYMGAGQAQEITEALLAEGLSAATPLALVENASLPDTRRLHMTVSDLPRVADLGIEGPALIMLGGVFAAALADKEAASSVSAEERAQIG
jgi:uroporphyrin-III C-methyltransferase